MVYTEQDTQYIIEYYKAAKDRNMSITELAAMFDVSRQSIITKLALEKVYVKPERYSAVTKGKPRKKDAIVRNIEDLTGMELEGLEEAPKLVLLALEKYIEET